MYVCSASLNWSARIDFNSLTMVGLLGAAVAEEAVAAIAEEFLFGMSSASSEMTEADAWSGGGCALSVLST